MSQKIMVTPEMLETAAGSIEGLANDYKAQYNQLYSETNALASTWQGADNQAFVNQIEGFKGDLETMYTLMNRYATYLRKTAGDYRDTQNEIVNRAKALQN